jgi:hypothetical protein
MALAILERDRRHAICAMLLDRKGKTRCGILSARQHNNRFHHSFSFIP